MSPQTLQVLSQIAIALGIILTGLGGFGAYHFGNRIDDQREAEASKREGELKADIQKLLVGNESLKQSLEPFEILAKNLHPDLGRDEALGKLRDELQAVKTRAADLEKKVSPRTLSPQQLLQIARMLKSTPPRSVDVAAVMGDAEAFDFARQIKDALEAGGWKVEGVSQSVFSLPTKGVVISVGKDPPPEAAVEFFRALQLGGFVATGNLDPNRKDDGVSIWVGSK